MEDKNKIDKFFLDQLSKGSKSDNDWFTPSDEIWENVEKDILTPTESKLRKNWLWVFFCFIGLAGSGSLIYSIQDYNNRTISNTSYENSSIKDNVANIITAELNQITTPPNSSNINETSPIESSNNKQKSTASNRKSSIGKTKSNIEDKNLLIKNSKSKTGQIKIKNEVAFNNTTKLLEDKLMEDAEVKTPKSSFPKMSPDASLYTIDRESNEQPKTSTNLNTDPIFSKNSIKKSNADFREALNYEKAKTITLVQITNNRTLGIVPPIIDVLPKTNYPRYEIGIGHNEYLLEGLIAIIEEGDDPRDKINADQSVFNLSLYGSKWINKKWSLKSGLIYSQADVKVDLSVYDELDTDLISYIYSEVDEVGINSNSQEEMILLKDGITVEIGDEIRMDALIDLHITAYQVPLFINYHLNKNKFEYLFGTGISLDYVYVEQAEIDIELFKNEILINEPFRQSSISEGYLSGSIYANCGMRYHIFEGLNAGITTKLSLLDLPFSSLEFSLNYRI